MVANHLHLPNKSKVVKLLVLPKPYLAPNLNKMTRSVMITRMTLMSQKTQRRLKSSRARKSTRKSRTLQASQTTTTTMKMMTGDLKTTTGAISILKTKIPRQRSLACSVTLISWAQTTPRMTVLRRSVRTCSSEERMMLLTWTTCLRLEAISPTKKKTSSTRSCPLPKRVVDY